MEEGLKKDSYLVFRNSLASFESIDVQLFDTASFCASIHRLSDPFVKLTAASYSAICSFDNGGTVIAEVTSAEADARKSESANFMLIAFSVCVVCPIQNYEKILLKNNPMMKNRDQKNRDVTIGQWIL